MAVLDVMLMSEPPPAGGHGVPHVLHEVDEAEVLDVGDLVQLYRGDVADHVEADDAGGVDGDVERAPLVDGGVGEGLEVVVVAAVAADGGGAGLGGQLLEVFLAAGGDDDLGAVLGEALGDGPADAARSPQDDCLLAVEESHAVCPLPETRARARSLRRAGVRVRGRRGGRWPRWGGREGEHVTSYRLG